MRYLQLICFGQINALIFNLKTNNQVLEIQNIVMQADFIGSCSNCTLACPEKEKQEFSYHQRRAAKHIIFSNKQFEQQASNFFNFCSLKVWDSTERQLQNYFDQVRHKIRNAQIEAMESINKLKMQTVLKTKDQAIITVGQKVLSRKYLSLQCRQIDQFLSKLHSNKMGQAELSKNISDHLFEIQSKIQLIFKNQIRINSHIKLSDSDLNMLRNFSTKSSSQLYGKQKPQIKRRYDDFDDAGHSKRINYAQIPENAKQKALGQNRPLTNKNNRHQTNQRDTRDQRDQRPPRPPRDEYRGQINNRDERQRRPQTFNRGQRRPQTRGQRGKMNHRTDRRQQRPSDVIDGTISTIQKINNSAGGKFNIQLKVLRIIDKFYVRGQDKIELEGGDSTGTSIYILKSSPLIKENAYLQVSQCYVYVFRGTKQIQSSQNSQIKQCYNKFQVSTAFNFSNKNNNTNIDGNSRNTQASRRRRGNPNYNRRGNQKRQQDTKSGAGSELSKRQGQQNGNRLERPIYRRQEDKNDAILKKISEIGPQDEKISLQAQVFRILSVDERDMFCQLGDDKGLVNAIIPEKYSFIKQGVSIRIQQGFVQVIDGHIFITTEQDSRIQKTNKQFKIINIGLDISQKLWEQVDD